MRKWLPLVVFAVALFATKSTCGSVVALPAKQVVVIPIQEEIGKPTLFILRRGLKEAIEHKADLVVAALIRDAQNSAAAPGRNPPERLERMRIYADLLGGLGEIRLLLRRRHLEILKRRAFISGRHLKRLGIDHVARRQRKRHAHVDVIRRHRRRLDRQRERGRPSRERGKGPITSHRH